MRLVLRWLRARAALATFAIVLMGAGIAASATIFTIVDIVDFRPLPFRNADRLVVLHEVAPSEFKWCHDCGVSAPMLREWTRSLSGVSSIAAQATYSRRWVHRGATEELLTADVSPNLFGLLGVGPARGRGFVDSDTASNAPPVVVISDALWRRGYSTDPQIMGKQLVVISRFTAQAKSYTIVGVMPRDFRLFVADAWMPLVLGNDQSRSARTLQVIARLAHQGTLNRLNVQLAAMSARLSTVFPSTNHGWGARAIDLRTATASDFGLIASGRRLLLMMVACLVAIALGNMVVLLRADTRRRRGELALRSALGAPRGHLVRQAVSQAMVLAGAASVVGMLLAIWAVTIAIEAFGLGRFGPVGFGARTVVFIVSTSFICAAACAIALRPERSGNDLVARLRSIGTIGSDAKGRRAQAGLIVADVACTLILLCAAGLVRKAILTLGGPQLGYDPDGLFLVVARIPPSTRGNEAVQRATCVRARGRFAAMLGTTGASCSGISMRPVRIRLPDGAEALPSEDLLVVRSVTPEFFAVVGTAIRHGRGFGSGDRLGAAPVAVASVSLAARLGGPAVIGPAQARETVLSLLREIASGMPDRGDVISMSELVASPLLQQQFNRWALTLLAALTLGLAVVGLYGSVTYVASSRAREVALRLVLGASPRATTLLVGGEGFTLALTGILVGIAASLELSRVFAAVLALKTSFDPLVTGGAVALLSGTAWLACYLPARRATTVDPASILREDGFRRRV